MSREDDEEYRKNVELDAAPFYNSSQITLGHVVEITKLIFKQGTALNAGGLLTIPTLFGLFGLDPMSVKPELMWSAWCFVGGLIACWLSMICAHASLGSSAILQMNTFNIMKYSHKIRDLMVKSSLGTAQEISAISGIVETAKIASPKYMKRAQILGVIAVLFSAITLCSFIWGAYDCGLALTNAKSRHHVQEDVPT